MSLRGASERSSGFGEGIEFEETFPESEEAPAPARPAEAAPARPHLVVVESAPPRADEVEDLGRDAVEHAATASRAQAEDLVRRIEGMLVEWQERFEQRLEQRRVDEERMAERRRLSDEERLRAWRTELEQVLMERFADRRVAERVALPERNGELRSHVRAAIAAAASARDVGRILRDVLSEIAPTVAFAMAIHHTSRGEVAYRYRVASEDEVGATLRAETLDDGPDSAAAHTDGWIRAQRTLRAGLRNVTVHTAQLPVRTDAGTIGVLTLQCEGEAIADESLSRVARLAELVSAHLAELRAAGSYRGI